MWQLSTNPDLYDRSFSNFKKPSVVGEMCVSREREVYLGRSRARYLDEKLISWKKCRLNLNDGFEHFENKDDLNLSNLNLIFKWLGFLGEPGCPLKKTCHEADIVCFRGILKQIASSPYDAQNSWRISAVRYKSVIFLQEFETEQKARIKESMTKREKLMSYWGFKFEHLITTESSTCSSRASKPVTNLEEFDVFVKSSIGGPGQEVRLLYCGEVDCIDCEGEYVEIKTQRKAFTRSFWRYKAMPWWIQSFLLGIQTIAVGFRDDTGIVDQVQRIKVEDLLNNAEYWSGCVNLHFLFETLTRLKETLITSGELVYHLVEYEPSEHRVTCKPVPNNCKFAFLSDEILAHIGEKLPKQT